MATNSETQKIPLSEQTMAKLRGLADILARPQGPKGQETLNSAMASDDYANIKAKLEVKGEPQA